MLQVVIKNGETWLICGGRGFSDQVMFDDVMSRLMGMWGCPSRVIHGDASGADKMAEAWAEKMAVTCAAFPANWATHGKAAGPIRNERMLELRPRRVIAFPGGRGTADMVSRAKERRPDLDVVEIMPAPASQSSP